ncbi:MAG: TetR/AcrR family transcriptional regulator [Rhodospirillales bacterium]|nr:TetR/AcrR family transcriptional regulator [Rhodospirillales bacterium]
MKTRTRILQATLNLLEASQGVGGKGVRMSDIATQAGISRQAVYLHFANRAELLIETTYYLDRLKDTEARLAASRSAETGVKRLNAFIEAWGSYIPEIYGTLKALMAMKDTDPEAAEAWNKRMQDMREGCEAAIKALHRDKTLSPDYKPDLATDILWTMLSVRTWEHLTTECGWPQTAYIKHMKALAQKVFVASA